MTTDRFLTAQELADALNVPLSWVREKTCRNLIPHLKLGLYVRYDLQAVISHFQKDGQGRGQSQNASSFLGLPKRRDGKP